MDTVSAPLVDLFLSSGRHHRALISWTTDIPLKNWGSHSGQAPSLKHWSLSLMICSGQRHQAQVFSTRAFARRTESPCLGPAVPAHQKGVVERLWQDFFSDPSQWWDNRAEKGTTNYPDFKHKKTHASLWLNSKLIPPWVESKLAGMAPGSVQSNIFSWNKRLIRCVKTGKYKKTIELFEQVQREGIEPDNFTFVQVLNACASLGALEEGRRVHMKCKQSGCDSDVYVSNSLIDMYAKCGSIEDAWILFSDMPNHNVISWNTMILAFVKCGQGAKALELSQQFHLEELEPSPVTFVAMLNACASVAALEEGRYVHELIIQRGWESNVFVGNSLIDMYAKCGSIDDAWRLFNQMPTRTVVAWSAMIRGFVKCDQGHKALKLSRQMEWEGMDPNPVTFVGILNACASIGALKEGKHVHEQIIQSRYESNVFVGNSLIDMYAKCNSIEDAHRVFRNMPVHDAISWNAMIHGYVKCGQGKKALALYQQMQQEGMEPDSITFVSLLKACASLMALEEGKCIHEQIMQRSCELDIFVGTSLVDMYAKCDRIEDAWRIFNQMPKRNAVSWNAMIQGYVKCQEGRKALKLSDRMRGEGVEPTSATFVGLLNACASLASLEDSRRVHEQVIQRG